MQHSVFSAVPFLIMRRTSLKLAMGVCASVLVLGCVRVMEPVLSEGREVRDELHVGDTVRVLTKNSERRTFRVAGFEPDVLVGEDGGDSVRVPYEDIVFLGRRELSRGATAIAVAGVVTSALLIITVEGGGLVPPPGL
jgi:hypothetical protein